jgi:hypothetical protein
MSEAIPPLSQYAFMAWCSVKAQLKSKPQARVWMDGGWPLVRIFGPKWRLHEAEKYFIMRNFKTYKLHNILLG